MVGAFIFIFGLIVGSFLNVVVLRLGTGESIVSGRSRCYSCGKTLKWYELIPLLSFIALSGRCRECKSKISWQYPAVELATALIFYALYIKWSNVQHPMLDMLVLGWWMVFWAVFLALAVYDSRHKILPDQLSYFLSGWALVGMLFFGGDTIWLPLIVGISLFLFFAALWLVSKGRWMGLGDAKLFFGVGVFLGWPHGLTALLFSFWTGAIIGSVAVMAQKSLSLKSEIPFAPFIFLGAGIAFLWGDALLNWYLKILSL